MDVLMPQLGETVAEGKITKWFKSAGDAVKPGDNLFEIETDKVSMEVPSTSAGVLSEIRVGAGEVALVGAIVAVIAGEAGAAAPAPVAAIQTFKSEEEVIRRANATEYGLVAYLYTKDLSRGMRVCEQLDFGMVGLNRGLVSDPAAPFGGMKQSGIGREGAHDGLMEYLETQYISVSW